MRARGYEFIFIIILKNGFYTIIFVYLHYCCGVCHFVSSAIVVEYGCLWIFHFVYTGMELNAEFITRTETLFGKERFSIFKEALGQEPVTSVRFNVGKAKPDNALDSVPWASEGRYLVERPVFTADPCFHAGHYYVQEASSMFLEQVIRQYVDSPVRALDLCAAPGGKTTHLLSLLPQGSMLLSNEPVAQRAQVLAENVIKWGCSSSVVTRNMPADFVSLRNFFDLVVVDAPCSGEGMFRKEPYAVEQWTPSLVVQCAKRQREILADIWGSLRPGGLLVYSTCTFNREENEDCVKWAVEELGAEALEVCVDPSWNITGSLTEDDLPVYRFIPGFTKGEGFFMAVMRKNGDAPLAAPRNVRWQQVPSKVKVVVETWVKAAEEHDFVMQGDSVVMMPQKHTLAMLTMQHVLNVLHCGAPVAELKNNKLQPLHTLAMSQCLNRDAFNSVELEREQALKYLHREALSIPGAPVGHLMLTYMGAVLGFVKNIGNRANNMYPSEWRIRKNPLEL